jgi:CDP-paratose synthetase
MNVLLTGSNGFLGSHILKTLYCHAGSKLDLFLTLRYNSDVSRIKHLKYNKIFVDSVQTSTLEAFFDQNHIEIIIHCATEYDRLNLCYTDSLNANLIFPLRLAELGSKYHLKYFINTDSYFNKLGIYYPAMHHYCSSKRLFISELVEHFGDKLKILNMRLEHVYGEDDSPNKFIGGLIDKLRANNTVRLTPGEQRRDFVCVSDVAFVYYQLCNNLTRLTGNFYDLEIGKGYSDSLVSFILALKKALNSRSLLDFGALPYRENEIMDSKANSSLAMLGSRINVDFSFKDISAGIDHLCAHLGTFHD